MTDDFIAIGTQLKVERPGKSSVIASCDTLEGPIVKLDDGSVVVLSDVDQAKSVLPRIAEVLVGSAPCAELFDKAADLLLEGAEGFGENDFKIPLARRTLHAVLEQATQEAV